MKRFLLLLLFLMTIFAFAAGEEPETVPIDDELLEEKTEVRPLKSGDEGDDVLELQIRLTELHYYDGSLTGNYGEATAQAIRDFQQDFELETSGEADQETLSMLYSVLYRPLRYGSTGGDVKDLQTRLTALAYYTGKNSGNYLESTRAAVESFQANNGLDPTGEADPETQEVLFSYSALSRNNVNVPTPTPGPATGTFLVDENGSENTVAVDDGHVFAKKLKNGSSGTAVKELQTRLTELGYYTGPISGNYLGKTTSAVKKVQEKHAMKVTGVVDEETWNLIFNDPTLLLPEDTPRPTPTPAPVPFALTVDVRNQVVTVYGRDENGDYTVVVRQMICSTGTKANPSDVGDWTLSGRKAKWCKFPKWGSYARYWTKINSSIAFHSVIYNSVSTTDMAVSSYKALGSRASHGCIRLTVADAKWIYDNVGAGTVVTITEKLPSDPELRESLKTAPLDKKSMTPVKTPVPTAEPAYTRNGMPPQPLEKLKKNNSSEAVYWLQCRLRDLGYYGGKCSGTYLEGTVNAVKAFEKDHGLRADGVADVKMQEKLYEDVLNAPTPTPAPETLPLPENE